MMMKSYRSWSFDRAVFSRNSRPRLLKFQFGCGEKDIGWKKIAGICRGDGLFRGSGPAEYIVDRDAVLNIKTEAEAQTPLRVQIHAQDLGPAVMQGGQKGAGSCCLSDAAFLIGDRDNSW